jgi:hypothetical protein
MNKNQVIKDIARFHFEWVRYVSKNSLSLNQKRVYEYKNVEPLQSELKTKKLKAQHNAFRR